MAKGWPSNHREDQLLAVLGLTSLSLSAASLLFRRQATRLNPPKMVSFAAKRPRRRSNRFFGSVPRVHRDGLGTGGPGSWATRDARGPPLPRLESPSRRGRVAGLAPRDARSRASPSLQDPFLLSFRARDSATPATMQASRDERRHRRCAPELAPRSSPRCAQPRYLLPPGQHTGGPPRPPTEGVGGGVDSAATPARRRAHGGAAFVRHRFRPRAGPRDACDYAGVPRRTPQSSLRPRASLTPRPWP